MHAELRVRRVGRVKFHRAALIVAKRPLHDVKMMRTPVAHAAAAVFAVMPPFRITLGHAARTQNRVVRPRGSRSQPHIPVQARFGGFFREIAGNRRTADRDLRMRHRADDAVTHQFAGRAKFAHGPLHAANLENSIIGAGGLHHRPAFQHGMRHGFLAINILARPGRRDGHERMPMIRRGNDDGINILPRQQIAEILVGVAAFIRAPVGVFGVGGFHRLFRQIQPGAVHIAYRQHADVLAREAGMHQAVTLLADADEAERDLFARGAVRRPQAGRQNERSRAGDGRRFDKMAPVNRTG